MSEWIEASVVVKGYIYIHTYVGGCDGGGGVAGIGGGEVDEGDGEVVGDDGEVVGGEQGDQGCA